MNQLTTPVDGITAIIARAAQDPQFDIDKLQRLLDMQTDNELRAGERAWNNAFAAAEAEMGPISADASNPQTRSRYATFARLDGAVRPIYTRHGFGISWNTEPAPEPNEVRVVGMLTNGIVSRRYQYDVPIETQGAKGTQFTTKTWAKLAATSYGKRILLTMMFNLAVGDDDNRNRAGGMPPRAAGAFPKTNSPAQKPPQNLNANAPTSQTQTSHEVIDAETGEVTEELSAPSEISFDTGDWRMWGERLIAHLRVAQSIDEIDQWLKHNQMRILDLQNAKPGMHKTLLAAIETEKARLTAS
jgi:hypothetical protein